MHPSTRLLAYLQPGSQTGLAGLVTHPTPRSALLFLYSKILSRMSKLPATSLYRQSVEATAKHRLALVESVVPAGYAEWTAKVQEKVKEHSGIFRLVNEQAGGAKAHIEGFADGRAFVLATVPPKVDIRRKEWDGEEDTEPMMEGIRSAEQKKDQILFGLRKHEMMEDSLDLEPEPLLTAEQISELENKIGAGLIEEVIQVAENELKAIDTLEQAKVWEPLEEQPAPGQWTYFERHHAHNHPQQQSRR